MAAIKDPALRKRYAVDLDRWLGFMDERSSCGGCAEAAGRAAAAGVRPAAPTARPPARGRPGDPAVRVEREVLKLAVQRPALLGPGFDALGPSAFTVPGTRPLYELDRGGRRRRGGRRAALGGAAARRQPPTSGARAASPRSRWRRCAADAEAEERYAAAMLAAAGADRGRPGDRQLKSRMQRLNPVEEREEYNRLFGELVALEQQRRVLRERATAMRNELPCRDRSNPDAISIR